MPDSVFRKEYMKMTSNHTFEPNKGRFNSMISSGIINNITNKELLYSLSSLEDNIIDALEEQTRIDLLIDNLIEKTNVS